MEQLTRSDTVAVVRDERAVQSWGLFGVGLWVASWVAIWAAIWAASSGCAALGTKEIPVKELLPRYGGEGSKFLEIEGMKIHYRDQGTGPALVMLHGVCASLHTWDGWVEALGDRYRLIRIDIPGFGLTGPAPDKKLYRREKGIELIDTLVTRLGLSRFSLVGNSLGGYIAWNYALAHPDKVDKLVLIDPVGYNQKLPGLLRLATHPMVRPFARHIMPRSFFDDAVDEVYGDPRRATAPIRRRYFELSQRQGNKSAYVDVFLVMKEENQKKTLGDDIKKIQTPTLVLWGAKDRWIPVRHLASWQRDLENGTFIVYEGIGHMPMEELPGETARDVSAFLEGTLREAPAPLEDKDAAKLSASPF